MTITLPKLHVYEDAVSIPDIARAQSEDLVGLVNFASNHYGSNMLLIGDTLGRAMNTRLRFTDQAPYVKEILETAEIVPLRGVRTLQHSFTLGCSTITQDVEIEDPDTKESKITPALVGTIDWDQVGSNLAPVVSLAVLDNPIKPESPVLSAQMGPAAFGLFMMNSQVSAKVNRAPIPNKRNKDIDFDTVTDAEYKKIKARNNLPYSLLSAANQIFTGRPSCAYLLRHAMNKDMDFEETLDLIVKTKTCDFGIITLVGKEPGQAMTIEKRGGKTHAYSAYEPSANHWNDNSPFAQNPSLPRTLNSKDRAAAIADTSRNPVFLNEEFSFARDGVIDHSTRVMASMNPASGEVALVTMHGLQPTSQAVKARFDGGHLENVQHFELRTL